MKSCLRALVLVASLLVGVISLRAQMPTKPTLNLEMAKKIAAKAAAEAVKNKWTMVIAIVDDGANLVYLEKIDGTQIGSIDVAQKKAQTASKFKRSTKVFEDRVAAGGAATGLLTLGILPLEGGLPIVVNDTHIGAIGVSGGTSAQDGQVAAAALAGP